MEVAAQFYLMCYADNNNSTHLCRIAHPLLSPLTHLLYIPSTCHLFACEPFSSSLCIVCSFHFTDHPTSSHSAVSVSHSAFLDDEEFSDFIQGPVEIPKLVPQPTSQPFQPFHSAAEAGQLLSEKAVVQPLPPVQAPVLSILQGTTGQVPYFPTSASSPNIHKTGNSKSIFFYMSPSVIELHGVLFCCLVFF